MIVKIWPIKGTQGFKNSLLYVEDENKVIKLDYNEDGTFSKRTVIDTQRELHKDADNFFIDNEEDISRVLAYIANEDKIKNKYISGYECDPQIALQNFETTWKTVEMLRPHKKIKNSAKEIMSYHMVQSFPEELDISDEEVHQCGMELLQKLENHQGVVCSHVHPVVDEEGEVHGKCKHNHILFNAFIQPDKLDPQRPDKVKYHDCKETYKHLRIWNDEIAIDHGLPIIRNPDLESIYSWHEKYKIKSGRSWKERIRLDIEDARRITNNWDEFKSVMQENGYSIDEGAYTTYITPDGEKRARGIKLGRSYTKESLQLYWTLRKRLESEVEKATKDNLAPPLWKIAQQYNEPLSAAIPLGKETDRDRTYYPLPLEKAYRSREVLNTYFNDKDLYDIRNGMGKIIATATGSEIIDYLEALQRGDNEQWKTEEELSKQEEKKAEQLEEERRRRLKEEEKERHEYYTSQFRNSRTHKYYSVSTRDKDGRRRSNVELVFLIAVVVLKNENGLWDPIKIPEDKENEAVFGPIDWKIQNMLDSIHIAEDEGIESPAEVDQRLDQVGASLSRARSAVKNTQRAKEKMEALADAIKVYDDTYEIAEQIQALPEGPQKEALKEQYKDVIEEYKKAKAVMYGYKVKSREEIEDFKIRYSDIEKNLPRMQNELDEAKEQYRKLKKLQYNLSLAQNAQYCYGPEYGKNTPEERDELWKIVTEHEFEKSFDLSKETEDTKELEEPGRKNRE